MALLSIVVFSPQLVFVPLMQSAINRRARRRIQTLREVSGSIVADPQGTGGSRLTQEARFESVFDLNMGIYKLKFAGDR